MHIKLFGNKVDDDSYELVQEYVRKLVSEKKAIAVGVDKLNIRMALDNRIPVPDVKDVFVVSEDVYRWLYDYPKETDGYIIIPEMYLEGTQVFAILDYNMKRELIDQYHEDDK